jgi:hypothetical protein
MVRASEIVWVVGIAAAQPDGRVRLRLPESRSEAQRMRENASVRKGLSLSSLSMQEQKLLSRQILTLEWCAERPHSRVVALRAFLMQKWQCACGFQGYILPDIPVESMLEHAVDLVPRCRGRLSWPRDVWAAAIASLRIVGDLELAASILEADEGDHAEE